MTDIPILILAAGKSSRMGKSKALLKWNGTTLIESLVDKYNILEKTILVVSGDNHEYLSRLHLKGSKIIQNFHWKKGMGKSIAVGVEFIINNIKEAKGVFILSVDQPFVSISHLKQMESSFYSKGELSSIIVSSSSKGYKGIPTLFGATYFKALSKLKDDRGAKSILIQHKRDIKFQTTNHLDLEDMDTPEMYKKLKTKLNHL